MDKMVEEYTDDFVKKLEQTEEFMYYHTQLSVIKNYPDLMEEINAYRDENFDIQNRYEGEELFDKMEEFTQKHEKLLENPRAFEFLKAEAAFCRMMQEVNIRIIEGLNFQ